MRSAEVEKQQLVALVSGSASTAFEIWNATKDRRLPRTNLALVISSNPDAGSYKRFVEKGGFDPDRFKVVRPQDFSGPDSYGNALLETMEEVENLDVLGQYGHTPKTPEVVVVEFAGRSINQHPGPVDPSPYDFGGVGMSSADRVHAARLMFVRETKRNSWTDVVAQRVAAKFDGGVVLKRGRVHINPDDTVDTLKLRAIITEREVQVEVLQDFESDSAREQGTYKETGIDLVLPGERILLATFKKAAAHLYPAE